MSKASRFVTTTASVVTIIAIAALGLKEEYHRAIESIHPYPPHGEKSVLVLPGYTELAACDLAGPSPLIGVKIESNSITFFNNGQLIRLPNESGLKITYPTHDPNELGQITVIPLLNDMIYRVIHTCIDLEDLRPKPHLPERQAN